MSDLYLFIYALRDLFRAKRLATALVLVVLPTALTLFWRTTKDFSPEAAYNTLSPGIVFGFILVILSVVFATGVLSQEVEGKTIVYLLTRPVSRWRILLMKFLAAVLATTLVSEVAALLIALTAYGPGNMGLSRVGRDLLILPVGALAYSSLFLLVATLLARPLLIGLVFAFGWETWVPTLPGDFQKVSLMSYLRVLAPHPAPESETVELANLFNKLNPQTISSPLAWQVMGGVIVLTLVAALFIFSTNEYVPRDDAE